MGHGAERHASGRSREGKRNASSAKTRTRGPRSDISNQNNDGVQNQHRSEQPKEPSDIRNTDAADTLYDLVGSGSVEPGISDDEFDQSFVDDKNPGPTDRDRNNEEDEQYNDGWEDGVGATNPHDARVFSKRPKFIVKRSISRRPTTGYDSRHGSFATSCVARFANERNNGDDRLARTGEKRRSDSPTQGEDSDAEVSQLCKPQQRSALTHHQEKKPPSDHRRRNISRTERSRFQLPTVSSEYIHSCVEMVLIMPTEKK
jgi:hypothetical protein